MHSEKLSSHCDVYRNVQNTTISGTIGDVQSSEQLNRIIIESTKFSGTVPAAFSDFPRLEQL